ncbi:MAG: glycosyltransferase [Pseudomonadota bacterium]
MSACEKPNPRVLLVYKHFMPDTGGIETSLEHYARWYNELGFDVSILCCRKKGIVTQFEKINDVDVIRCGTVGIVKSVPISFSFFWYLLKFSRHVCLVHAHLQFPLVSFGYWLLKSIASKKWIVTYHMDVYRQKFLKKITYPFDFFLLKNASKIITSSPSLKYGSDILPDLEKDIEVLPFTLNLCGDVASYSLSLNSPFASLKSGYFLFFGRMVEYKGVKVFSSAIRECLAVRSDIQFLIFGEGPEDSWMESVANDYPQNVFFLNEFISEDDKYKYIANSSVFVFPSVHPAEAFGIAQLEAMALGKPIINCNINTGVNWVQPNDVCAITVTPGDSKALSTAIIKLKDDVPYRNKLGDASHARYKKLFSEDVVKVKFFEIIESVKGLR